MRIIKLLDISHIPIGWNFSMILNVANIESHIAQLSRLNEKEIHIGRGIVSNLPHLEHSSTSSQPPCWLSLKPDGQWHRKPPMKLVQTWPNGHRLASFPILLVHSSISTHWPSIALRAKPDGHDLTYVDYQHEYAEKFSSASFPHIVTHNHSVN